MPETREKSMIIRSPGLDRGFALSGASAHATLYLRPLGLLEGATAAVACAAGQALPLAGGPLAFTHCDVLARKPDGIAAAVAPLAELRSWARRQGDETEAAVNNLLSRIASPRSTFAGLSLDRPRLMGIVNATPDSFSEGGEHFAPAAAIARGHGMIEAGADIIDIGGESTRPGAAPVDPREELARIRPVVEGLARTRAVLSVDTRHSEVMAAALASGAAIINDITALVGDPRSLPLVAAQNAHVVLMHMQGEPPSMNRDPRYEFAPLDIYDALAARVTACLAAGIPRNRIAIDPGIGFGKKPRHNFEILRYLSLFHGLGCAVLVGASRKIFVKNGRGPAPPKARLGASLGAALTAVVQGAQLLRVHDVEKTRQAMDLWWELAGAC